MKKKEKSKVVGRNFLTHALELYVTLEQTVP